MKRFAEHPDRSGMLGFVYLLRRCENHVRWELSNHRMLQAGTDKLLKLRTGARSQASSSTGFIDRLADSDAARTEFYKKVMESLGNEVDLPDLTDAKQEKGTINEQ